MLGDAGNSEGPTRNAVDERIDPTGKKSNLTFCEVLGTASNGPIVTSPLDVGVAALYQQGAMAAGCPATSWERPSGKNGEPTGLIPNPQDPTRYFCQRSQPVWSAYRYFPPPPPLSPRSEPADSRQRATRRGASATSPCRRGGAGR